MPVIKRAIRKSYGKDKDKIKKVTMDSDNELEEIFGGNFKDEND